MQPAANAILPSNTHKASEVLEHAILTAAGSKNMQLEKSYQDLLMSVLGAAEQELEMVTTLFNNMVSSCHSKCITPTYHDTDLNKGESVCIDRCVHKYFEVNMKVGAKLSGMNNQQQQA